MAKMLLLNVPATVRQILLKVIEREFVGLSPTAITDEADLSRDLGLDSLHIVGVLAEVERTFEIGISDEDAQGLQTVGQIVRHVEELLAELDNPLAPGAA